MPKPKTTKNNLDVVLKTAPRIIDVQSDSTVGASSSSRPMIVSTRPLLRDPMMAPDAAPAESLPGVPRLSSASPIAQPLAPPSMTKKRLTPTDPQLVRQAAPDVPKATTAAAAPPASTEVDTVTRPRNVVKTETESVVTHDSIPVEGSALKKVDSTSDNSVDAESDGATSEENEADAASKAEAATAAKIDTLVEARTYALPINAVQKRRSQQMAVFGLVVIVVLAVAWLDIATDVGLIKVAHFPLTHFFGH
jgi:hypothetical protein